MLVFVLLENTRVNSVHVVGTKMDFVNAKITLTKRTLHFQEEKCIPPPKEEYFRKSISNSIFAPFNVNFEARRKYIVVYINNNPVKFQSDTTSDITLGGVIGKNQQ